MGQKYVTSLHCDGNPSYKTDDGTGSWGGDWGAPVAAASEKNRVFLGWGHCESGWNVICVDQKLTPNQRAKKLWGKRVRASGVGSTLTALDVHAGLVFVALDGPEHKSSDPLNHAGVLIQNVSDGSPQNFPFGERVLPISAYNPKMVKRDPDGPLFKLRENADFGPTLNLTDIAVVDDILAASLRQEDRVVLVNWKTGDPVGKLKVESPAGIEFRDDGTLVIAGTQGITLYSLKTGKTELIARGELTRPWGLSIDSNGRIAVADCADTMRVKIFSSKGKLKDTIGKEGGRSWIGSYVKKGMLMPAGISYDGQDKLWVTEFDDFPRRVSVWDRQGELVADLHGPSVPQNDRDVIPDEPELVNVHHTLYRVNYDTGESECVSTLWRPHYNGWTSIDTWGHASRYAFRKVNGQTYAFLDHGYSDRLSTIFKFDGEQLHPIASWGRGYGIPLATRGQKAPTVTRPEQILSEEKAATYYRDQDRQRLYSNNEISHRWIDGNGDGVIQDSEFSVEANGPNRFFIHYVDEELTLWGRRGQGIYRVPVESWTEDGIPIYPTEAVAPLCMMQTTTMASLIPDLAEKRFYTIGTKGGDTRNKGDYAAIECYDFDGNLIWAYTDTWYGFALDAPFWKPGYVIGCNKPLGMAKLDDGTGLIVFNGYQGMYHCLTTDGLWLAMFGRDNRYGPKMDANSQWIENFTGRFFRNQNNGKVYLIGGDIDARIWEITGLESIRRAEQRVTISAEDAIRIAKAAGTQSAPQTQNAFTIPRRTITVDGELTDWQDVTPTILNAQDPSKSEIYLAYDDMMLYALYRVEDSSPMQNVGGDFRTLFKAGDSCDIMLGTDADAPANRLAPAPGDLRILMTETDGEAIAVIFEKSVRDGKKKEPHVFTSPTGTETFDRVAVITDARIAVKRKEKSYILEAAIPLSQIGFKPEAGKIFKADMGVLFSNQGGSQTTLRAYIANQNTGITEDIPSEARLQPQDWGTLNVE